MLFRSFKHSIRDEWLARHLGQEKPRTMAALTSLMTRFCVGEDSWLARCSSSNPSTSEVRDGNEKSRRNSNNKHRNKRDNMKSTAVNAGFKSSRPGQQKPPLKAPGTNCPAYTKFWTKYVRSIAPLANQPIIPTENVGSSSSPASSTPYTRGRIHQVKMRTNLRSKTRGNKRNFHPKSKQ